jgi:hypothetical protein
MELKDTPTVANFATVQNEGGRDVCRNVEHYNLDVIISVGYRVKSANGVKFRQWANQVLKDHLLKGYRPLFDKLLHNLPNYHFQ